MSLAPGARLGAYEILSLLGAGGMGEVYRARDTRLNRTVAIKILRPQTAADPQFKERFHREALAISSLDHPNICALFDVGEHADTAFLVMQYLEGETLEARLQKGALPVGSAVQHAIEIADALDKAHRHGIVHRDLKPGNIMLTKSGAKLLDFGLAKASEAPAAGALSMVPTTPANLTAQGTILGTFRYMAPEQLEGGQVDTRTDIFAFGVIVYEMLTGTKAFEGKSQASLIAAILDHEPPPISSSRPAVPRFVDHIVRRCLAKNPDARWQSARDLCDELQWVAREQLQIGASLETRHAASRSRRGIAPAIAAAAVIVAAAVVGYVYLRQAAPAREMRFEITVPAVDMTQFALSPDGTRVAAALATAGQRQLWVRSLESGSWQPLRGTDGASHPFWSPDSRSIGFFAESKLKRIDVEGGVPQTLAEASPRGGTWNADGVIVFAPNVFGALARISAAGGEQTVVTKPRDQSFHRQPFFLPDGKRFIYFASGPPDIRGIYLASLDSPDSKRLVAADGGGTYASTGWILFSRQAAVLARRFDAERAEMIGDDVAVANTAAFVSASTTGLVAYRAASARSTQLVWTDRSGQTLGTLGGPPSTSGNGAPRLSADGRRVAMSGGGDILLVDEVRTTRFTFDPAVDRYPVWSPDGRRVVFDSIRGKGRHLYISTSPGGEDLLLETPQNKTANDWSPDGRHILFQSNDPKTGIDLWVLPIEGTRQPYVFLRSQFNERRAAFSPDGRWVTYLSNESGRYEVYVRRFFAPTGDPHGAKGSARAAVWQISTSGGLQPRWNPNGREIHYTAPDGKLMTVPVKASSDALEVGAPAALFQTRMAGIDDVDTGLQYDIAPDGRFLMNTMSDDASSITVIVNWTPSTGN